MNRPHDIRVTTIPVRSFPGINPNDPWPFLRLTSFANLGDKDMNQLDPAGSGPHPADVSSERPRAVESRRRIVVIEDDRDIADAMSYALDRAGFSVRVARTGEEGLDAVRKGADLVLLDLNLPGMDGLEVCRMLRRQPGSTRTPILIVSARGEEVDRVLGLEMGADDYLVKPFSMKELVARCKVGLRRLEAQIDGPVGYVDENFEIEFDAYVLRYKGEEIRLTHKEFELVRYMVERAGRVLTRERLLDRVWGQDAEVDARSVDAHVRRLRAKLGPARHHVETVIGIGYRFVR
jgi:two-component system phosphate regulon response regulator PhoB